MKESCLFVLFQWFMKHTNLGCLWCVVVFLLSLVLTLQSELLLLLIMLIHHLFIYHVVMESNITQIDYQHYIVDVKNHAQN